jgi:hypothetical protein
MSTINIYDKNSKEWKSVSSNQAANIMTTNSKLVDSGNTEIDLEKALDKICNNITTLQGNTAWLATYGGGGSGGGGGTTTAEVIVSNADITVSDNVNIVYVTSTSYELNYTVKEPKSNQKYYVTINLDGTNILTDNEVYSNKQQTFVIDNINKFTSVSPHKIIITAYDTDELNATPYNLVMNESSIKLSAITEDNKSSISAAIGKTVNLMYSIESKIIGQEITLSVKNQELGITYNTTLPAATTSAPRTITVDFFKNMFGNNTPVAGSTYRITAKASVPLGEIQVVSDEVTTNVVIEDSNNLVIITDGITTEAQVASGASLTTFYKGGNISFSFTPYLANDTVIYYAAKVTYNGNEKIIGDFDNYSNNASVTKGNSKLFSLSIPDEDTSVCQWTIELKCWSEKGSPSATEKYLCNVIQSTNSLLPDPNPDNKRYSLWNSKSTTFPTNVKSTEWLSNEKFQDTAGNKNTVETKMNIYETNGIKSGCLTENNQPMLRLYNESYAIIDISPFSADTTSIENWSKMNFTLSFTFKSDSHPYKDRTVAFCGVYSNVAGSEDKVNQGIKIGLESATWTYKEGTLTKSISCNIEQNVLNTIDFVKADDTVKIYKNGVLQIGREIEGTFYMNFDEKIYLACDKGKTIGNFCDVDFFNVGLFRRDLTPKEIVVNSMNCEAKASLKSDGTIDYAKYSIRKISNFFNGTDSSSSLYDDNNRKFQPLSFVGLVTSQTTSPLPILSISCAGSGFTRKIYERLGTNSVIYTPCNGKYYDPNSSSKEQLSFTNLGVQIQGTSSVNYRSKNIELYFQGSAVAKDGTKDTSKTELFQPISSWMPEGRFTLKADIVDSAHANNASIGKWINENASTIFEDTPPMKAVKAHPIKDTIDTGTTYSDVTVKHTLEGFPIILLLQFDGESTETMLGIYSFNLGRGAYFNMGFQFLKSFTRKTIAGEGNYQDHSCPALVKTYEIYGKGEETKNVLGIDESQIYSYEFSLNENVEGENATPTGLFWQDALSIIQYQGEFKYNGSTLDGSEVPKDSYVWKELQYLFSDLAGLTGSEIKKYERYNDNYVLGSGSYPANSQWGTLGADLQERLSLTNAYGYFMVSIIFGLVDSLGKNMTLRSWNVSNADGNVTKWYPAFYDMDTANGESNIGNDDVPKTAYIDVYSNAITDGVNSLVIEQSSSKGGYDEFSSRLWDVLRDSRFKNAFTGLKTYEDLWNIYRTNDKLLADSNYYIDNFFASQTKNCGELLYNYDYEVKYLTKYQAINSNVSTYGNIEFLHGTRVEFVRDWLKKRFIFLDGVFSYNGTVQFPYNTFGTFALGGSDLTELTVRTTAPTILSVSVAQKAIFYFYIPEDEDTKVRLGPLSSFNTQISLNNTQILSKINGLTAIRYQGMKEISLPSLSEFDISSDTYLNSEPIDFKKCFNNEDGKKNLRHLNLSNTKFYTNESKNIFPVDLSDYEKLKDINISYSCVSTISLPTSNLSELHLDHSDIQSITLANQNFISSIDVKGCNRLTDVTVKECKNISTLVLSYFSDLQKIEIINCPKITSITCTNNAALTSINVVGCSNLQYVDFSYNTNTGIQISISATKSLTEVNLHHLNTTNIPILPQINPNLVTLNIKNTLFDSIQFGSQEITKYNGENVLDLSMYFYDGTTETGSNVDLKKLNLYLTGMSKLKYLKLGNDSTNPYQLSSNYFSGCLALKRVFGYVSLVGTGVFNGCYPYYIRDASSYTSHDSTSEFDILNDFSIDTSTEAGKKTWNTSFNISNIDVNTTNLSSEFENTSVSLYDVYYIIMNKCQNVTNLDYTFYGDRSITLSVANENLNRYLFRQCGNVTSMVSMFWYAFSNGSTSLFYSPEHETGSDVITKYNGILSPLKSLQNYNNVFGGYITLYGDDMVFYPIDANGTTLKITSLSNIGYKCIKNSSKKMTSISDSDYTYALSSRLLKYLPNITTIDNAFNGMLVNFDLVKDESSTVQYCPIFYNNTKLTVIYNSFYNCKARVFCREFVFLPFPLVRIISH